MNKLIPPIHPKAQAQNLIVFQCFALATNSLNPKSPVILSNHFAILMAQFKSLDLF
jgi:hypothetical protein